MNDPKCARMLLGAAERDLLTLRNMTAGAPDESYGFHVQQAAEKSLKAWLALLGETYPLTHNLETLMNLLDGRDADVEAHRELTVYTPYAVEFRYGGLDSSAEPIDRKGALALVEALLDKVREDSKDVVGND
ncbi:MAG: HEPN domain-containing protein [Gemmatimonadaceae bacterium]|nr:HEPN domain-containing protein [Gemmatimonadaceae bacterium]